MVMLFVLPALVTFYRLTPTSSKSAYISVAIYNEDTGSENSVLLTERLVASNHIFKFYEVDSAEKLQNDIIAKDASFGFIIPEGFFESVSKEDYSNKIMVYKTPSSQLVKSAYEIIFGLVFDISSPARLAEYLSSKEEFSGISQDELFTELKADYTSSKNSENPFSIKDISSGTVNDFSTPTALNIPFTRIAGLMIFLSAFIGLFSFIIDRENKLFNAHFTVKMVSLALSSVIAFSIPAFLVSLVSVIIADVMPFKRVIFELSIYTLCMIALALVCGFIIRKSTVFSKVLPVYIILMIIFGGIFFDVTGFSSTLGFIARFFPTSYL